MDNEDYAQEDSSSDAAAAQDEQYEAEASAAEQPYDLVIAADAVAPDNAEAPDDDAAAPDAAPRAMSAQEADEAEEDEIEAGEAVRHSHSFYSAKLVFDSETSVLAEQQVTIEHEHPLTAQYAGHFGGPYGLSEADGGPVEVAPFVPEKFEPQGFLIPRQPERERGEREGERPREIGAGRPRRTVADNKPRGGQLTQAQLDSGQIMISKSRMPPRLLVRQVRAYLERERSMALDVRDALAITYASERYNVLGAMLNEMGPDDEIDLLKPLLTVSQAAKMLGYNAKELRRLLGQGKVSGRKVGSEWRIPLRAVL